MKRRVGVFAFVAITLVAATGQSQHCAPILESYLGQISVTRSAATSSLEFDLRYVKSGGRTKDSYQYYLLAYLESDEKTVLESKERSFADDRKVCVLQTGITRRDANDFYPIHCVVEKKDFVRNFRSLMEPIGNSPEKERPFNEVKDNALRVALVIPFLEDTKHSKLDGLPVDRHECNYRGLRALLFQPLPYRFGLIRLQEGNDDLITINQQLELLR